jgi:hypothetical protein
VQDQVRVRPLHQALLGFQPCRFRQIYGVPAPSGFRCRARSMNREALIGTLQPSQDADECGSCTVCRYEASSASAPSPAKAWPPSPTSSTCLSAINHHHPASHAYFEVGWNRIEHGQTALLDPVAFSYTALPFVLLAVSYAPLVSLGSLSFTVSSGSRP